MKLKCILGFHNWEKLGGPTNVGGGRFAQNLICTECRKIKHRIS
jgi:hypothetical protein